MRLDSGDQQIRIVRPPIVNLAIGDDPVLCLPQFHHLAKLVGLAGRALANDFRRRLNQAKKLVFTARIAAEDAGSGLFHHLPDARPHLIELTHSARCCKPVVDRLTPLAISSEKRLACPTTGLVVFSYWRWRLRNLS